MSLFLLPASRWLLLAVPIYFIMGSSRGVGGIAISSEMMEIVPRYMMGRVQNMFSFGASALQIATSLIAGEAAHRDGLTYGFWIVGAMYLGAASRPGGRFATDPLRLTSEATPPQTEALIAWLFNNIASGQRPPFNVR